MNETKFSHQRLLLNISIVALPIVILGVIGNLIGLSTLLGGALINLGYVLAILLGRFVLIRHGSSWKKIGLSRPANWLKTVFLGVGAFLGALLIFVVTQMIAFQVLTSLGMLPTEIDQSRFNPVTGNLTFLILMVVLAWTTISFGEEMFYRAFLISQLVDHGAIKKWGAILISGILFGVVHFAEGPVGIFSNSAFGILFGAIYVRSGRNLWITIIAHGLLNTLRFVLLYTGLA